MPTKEEHRGIVTDHVIVRWLERVEGYDFDDIKKELKEEGKEDGDRQILEYLADKFGLFRGHVIFRIATKQVRNAIQMGAKRIHRGNQTLVISDGRIVTLTPRKR